jgi:hypothetical protein
MIRSGGYYWSSIGWKFTRQPLPNSDRDWPYALNVEHVVTEEGLNAPERK